MKIISFNSKTSDNYEELDSSVSNKDQKVLEVLFYDSELMELFIGFMKSKNPNCIESANYIKSPAGSELVPYTEALSVNLIVTPNDCSDTMKYFREFLFDNGVITQNY